MAEYRRGAHTVFEIHLHLVWITKYRRPALQGEIAIRVRDLIRDICGQHEVSIMKGHVSKDHVHLLISLPPQVTISRLMQWLKGRTLRRWSSVNRRRLLPNWARRIRFSSFKSIAA
jgi:putative transposase